MSLSQLFKNRIKNRSTRLATLAAASLLAGGTVMNSQLDISGRVSRALDDRSGKLRSHIDLFEGSRLQHKYMEINRRYYSEKYTNPQDIDRLAQSSTNFDILAKLFQVGGLTEYDFLNYVIGSHDRIVTEPGVVLQAYKVSENGERTLMIPSYPDDLFTAFLADVLGDRNNPKHKPHNMQIEKIDGGYRFLMNPEKNKKQIIEISFQLAR